MEVQNCPNCTYCVITSDGVHHDNTVLFGLSGENEDLQNYDSLFSVDKETDSAYKVLSFCILEVREYDFVDDSEDDLATSVN